MAAFDTKTSALTLNNDAPEVTRPFQISDLENLYNLLYTCVASNYDILGENGFDEPAIIAGGDVIENESSITVSPVVFSFRGKIFVSTSTIEVSRGSSYGLCLVEQNTDNRVFGDGVTRPFASVGLVVAAPDGNEAPAGLVKRLGYPYESQTKIWKNNAWYSKEIPGGSITPNTVFGSVFVDGSIPESKLQVKSQTGTSWFNGLVPCSVAKRASIQNWGDSVGLGDVLFGPAPSSSLSQPINWIATIIRIVGSISDQTLFFSTSYTSRDKVSGGLPNIVPVLFQISGRSLNTRKQILISSELKMMQKPVHLNIQIPDTAPYTNDCIVSVLLVRIGDVEYIPASYVINTAS